MGRKLATSLALLLAAGGVIADSGTLNTVDRDTWRRLQAGDPALPGGTELTNASAVAPTYRTYDGRGNNLRNPLWGSAGVTYRREDSGAAYADGLSAPAGPNRPSPRLITIIERATAPMSPASGLIFTHSGIFVFFRTASVTLPRPAFQRAAPQADVRRGNSPFVVQLGAFSNEGNAERAWLQYSDAYGLEGRRPLTTTIDINGRRLNRVSVSGFASAGDAQRLCGQIREQGGECFVRGTAGDASIRWAARYANPRQRNV